MVASENPAPSARRRPMTFAALGLILYFVLGCTLGLLLRLHDRQSLARRAPVWHVEALTEALVLLRQGRDAEAAAAMEHQLSDIVSLSARYPEETGLARLKDLAPEPDLRAGVPLPLPEEAPP